ncbi:hypothetical protein [Pseudooceanicola nanhaiensis]|uniref:hypothetical protein n=1 Tax=Pseudooceanicola nanhaiensis TaxID=375761 RepID=UPI004058A57A
MSQPIDWEAEMQEIRTKATAAARHSERIVGGVSQALAVQKAHATQLHSMSEKLNEIVGRLGSLEAAQKNLARSLAGGRPARQLHLAPLLPGLVGLCLGVVLSAAFFGS